MKKIISLVLALCMILTIGAAFAADGDPTYVENAHDVAIKTHGVGQHTYGAFQIFKGDLDQAENKLANIVWGSAMTSSVVSKLATKVAADNTIAADFAAAFAKTDATEQARAVAAVLGGYSDDAAKLQAFADAINDALDSSPTNPITGVTNNQGVATIRVPNDGYYFFKDTETVGNKDTTTRFMLKVVNDLSVEAKDTVLTPDKEIVEGGSKKKQDQANIGDTITYEVTIPVPNTALYKDHFVFHMNDKLDGGLTFTGISSIKVGSYEFLDSAKNGGAAAIVAEGYDGTTGYYTLKVNDVAPTLTEGKYEFEATDFDATNATGGQKIYVVFNDFKKVAEKNSLINGNLVITYTAVLNKDATVGGTPNENEVSFLYSNDPNHEYDGDDFGPNEPKGETPKDITKTYVTTLKVYKVDGNGNALPGAVFRITGTTGNKVVESGEKFEATGYTVADGEVIVANEVYYKLLDGTYTTTAPVENTTDVNLDTTAQYEAKVNGAFPTYVKVTYTKVSTMVFENGKFDITRTSGDDGYIVLKGLIDGTFTVQEITAPAGYNIDNTEYKLNIQWNAPDPKNGSVDLERKGGFTKGNGSDQKFTEKEDGTEFSITIVNNSGTTLPSTGGIGTTIFYILGGLLVIGAAVILVARRKAHD